MSPAPPGPAAHPLGSISHTVEERVQATGLRCLLPIVHRVLDVGTEVGRLPRGCSEAAERLQQRRQAGGLRGRGSKGCSEPQMTETKGRDGHWGAFPGRWTSVARHSRRWPWRLLSEQKELGFDKLGQRNPLSRAVELMCFLIESCFSQIMLDYQIA